MISLKRVAKVDESFLINALGGYALHGKFIYHEREVPLQKRQPRPATENFIASHKTNNRFASLVAAESNNTGKHTFRLQRLVIFYYVQGSAVLLFASNFMHAVTRKRCSSKTSRTVFCRRNTVLEIIIRYILGT